MDFERGLGRRGQEGVTLTTLLLIILGVVAVVVVILFFTGAFDKIGGWFNSAGSDLQTAVSACNLAGSSGLTADYCSTFRKVTVNGVVQYQTCEGIKEKLDATKIVSCSKIVGNDDAIAYCASQKLAAGTIVEGLTNAAAGCPDYTAAKSACDKLRAAAVDAKVPVRFDATGVTPSGFTLTCDKYGVTSFAPST